MPPPCVSSTRKHETLNNPTDPRPSPKKVLKFVAAGGKGRVNHCETDPGTSKRDHTVEHGSTNNWDSGTFNLC